MQARMHWIAAPFERQRNRRFGFIDVDGKKITGDKKLTCQLTVRDGRVVWDLNGLAAPEYKQNN